MKFLHHSNQYHKGLRPKTKNSIKYVGYLTLVGVLTCLAIEHYPFPQPKIISPIAIRAAYADYQYIEPTLNPNISQRDQNIDLIKRIWGKDAWVGLNIARCESGYRTYAYNNNTNGTQDQGVFQENTVHNMPNMFDPVANISFAYTQYLTQSTTPWISSEKCWNQVLTIK